MTQTNIRVADRTYRFSPDESARGPLALWAVITGRAIDELTLAPPSAPLWLRAEEAEVRPWLGPNGMFSLLQPAEPRFPTAFAPGFVLHISLGAERYLPRSLAIPVGRVLSAFAAAGTTVLTLDSRFGQRVGQSWVLGNPAVHEAITIAALGPGPLQITLDTALVNAWPALTPLLPGTLTALDLGDVLLHRQPLSLRGRVMAWVPLANAFQPVAGADVSIPFIWRKQADTTNDAAKEALRLVALSPGLYRDRVAPTDTLSPLTEVSIPADDKQLSADVQQGDGALAVSNALGLVSGSLLRVDREHPDVSEVVTATNVTRTGTAAEPARVTISTNAGFSHAHGITVEHVNVAPTLIAKPLQSDGAAGDPVVFLSDVIWAGTPTLARVGAGASAEYQRIALFATTTDSDGYFTLPPISRVAQVRVAVTPPAAPTQNLDLQPDYRADEQWLDVKFS